MTKQSNKLLAEVKNLTEHIPLTFSNWQIHLGMGVVWTVMFNIVNSVTNICNDAGLGIDHHPDSIVDRNNGKLTLLRMTHYLQIIPKI